MSQLELNLNFNYGKRVVGAISSHGEAVAVNTQSGMEHFKFGGFLHDIELPILERLHGIDNIKHLTFFGSSGYRYSDNDSWVFCEAKESIVAICVHDTVFALLDKEGAPVTTKSVVERHKPASNVINLFK